MRRLVAGVTVVCSIAMTAVVLTGVAVPAAAAAPSFTTPCFTPATRHDIGSYTVPATGVSAVRVVLHGQKGGDASTARGGAGSRLVAELAVTPGQTLVLGSLSGASGGTGAPRFAPGDLPAGYAGGNGGAAQFVSTLGDDNCQHVLALAGGGGGAGAGGGGGNADAGAGATGGANGGNNWQADAGGGGGATATSGGSGGAAGSSTFGWCSDGNAGSWGGLWSNGRGGDAVGTGDVNPCYDPRDGGGGGGAGYYYGGGGGSPYALGAAAGGGGGSSYVHPSVQKISLTASTADTTPIAAPLFDTATAIASTPNPSFAGQTVTINTQTTVLGTSQPVGLGEVTIRNGSTVLATLPLDANGRTSMTTSALPVGDGALSATFASVENATVAYRASSTAGSIAQKVHPCAPAPTFSGHPADLAATTGTTATLGATASVAAVYGGVPAVRWQTSSDNGGTWTDVAGTSTVTNQGVASFPYAVTGGARILKYRAIATTCGGSTTSNAASLTVRAIAFDLNGLPAKTFGTAPFSVAGYAAGSNVPVGFSSATPNACSVSGSTVTVLAAGTCTLTARESGSNGYPAAPQVQDSFTTGKKPITVTAVSSPLSQPYGTATMPTVACNASGFVGGDTYTTAPLGQVGYLNGRTTYEGDTGGFIPLDPRYIDGRAQGSYIARCEGGNPGSDYTITRYVDGTFRITALDVTAPVVTVPAAMTREATSASGAAVSFAATAQDVIDGATTVTCNRATGSTFALGTTTVTCSATDDAGNTGTAAFTVTVRDTTGPVVAAPADVTVEASSADGAVATFAVATATDAVDSATAVTCDRTTGSTFAPGVTMVTCSSTDAAGNTGNDTFDVTVQDTTAPETAITGSPALVTTSTNAVFAFGGTDLVGVARFECQLDGGGYTACTSLQSYSGLSAGSHTFQVRARDAAGNTDATPATFTWLVDTAAPVVSVPADKVLAATSADGATASFTASARDAVDGDRAVTCAPASGSVFALGTTEVTCSASDLAGNVGSASFDVTVSDTTAPVVSAPDDKVLEATSADGARASFTASAVDVVDGDRAVTCAPASGSMFAIGTTEVTCSATDAVGNVGSATFDVTVSDTTAPVVTVPADKVLEATSADGATASFTASARDAVDGDRAVTCAPASGSTFALGTTEVTCSARDAVGNVGSARFDITVSDTTAPVMTVPADKVLEATSADGATASFTASAQDVVDGDRAVTCDPASGSMFALGTTRVTCSASDAAGNVGSARFDVMVSDTTAPAVSVPANKVFEATSADGARTTFEASAVDVVDGDRAVTCAPASGSTFALGTTEVICSASDVAGNVGSARFDVTVSDTTAPVVSVPADKVFEATSAGGVRATFGASAMDAVGGDRAVTCDPASGSTFALGTTQVTCVATDAAGNQGSARFDITVLDTTAPTTSLGNPLPASPSNADATQFGFTGDDAVGVKRFECRIDGAAFAACSSPVSYSGLSEGSHTFQVRAVDAAGNSDPTPASVTWVVDTVAPVITGEDATVDARSAAGATVPFTVTATDSAPSSPAVTCTRASGSVFTIGVTRVTCSATDAAGNTGSGSFTVTVRGAVDQLANLYADVQSQVRNRNVRTSLLSLLETAQAAAARGNDRAACDKVTSFINKVQAQSGKKIPSATADVLIVDARRIRLVLGCR